MTKLAQFALTAAMAASLAACGPSAEQNQVIPQNAVLPAPEAATNIPAEGNKAEAAPVSNVSRTTAAAPADPPSQPAVRRTPPSQKAQAAPPAAERADPHAGHDMGNMMHNQR